MNSNNLIAPNTRIELAVSPIEAGNRLDRYLAKQFPLYSRTFFNRLIDEGRIAVNDIAVERASTLIKASEVVSIQFPPERTLEKATIQERVPSLEIVHEDKNFLVVYKPAGLLVHAPSAASTAVTLVDRLLVSYEDLKGVGYTDRPGIIHRLDKDTSGILIIPRNALAHKFFGDLFRERNIKKTYFAVVHGHPPTQGVVDLAIGRDPVTKTKMTTKFNTKSHEQFRDSTTYYRVVEYFNDAALVEVNPITGRTHQIRVHLASIGHSIIGDPVYGRKSKLIKRHALHAYRLAFTINDKPYEFTRDMPEDLTDLIAKLRKNPAPTPR